MLPIRDQLELFGKIVGIAGLSFAALRASISYARDHSLGRRATTIVNEIDALLGRLIKLESEKTILGTPEFEQYKLQVREDLQAKLRGLEAIRAQKCQRALERNAEAQGISRWLLFYRPEGFDGLLIQSFYYSLLLAIIMMAIAAPIVVIVSRELGAGLFILLFIPLYVLFALYLRNVSLRLKSVGNAARLKSSKQLNCDISWLRRNLLIFKKGDNFWGLRAFYYLFLFDAVYTPVRPPEGITFFSSVLYSGGMLLLAQTFKVDALSRRAKTYLSSQFAANADVEPRSVAVGSDDVKEVGKSKWIA